MNHHLQDILGLLADCELAHPNAVSHLAAELLVLDGGSPRPGHVPDSLILRRLFETEGNPTALYEAIATLEGISVAAAKSRCAEAVARLRCVIACLL